MTSRCLTTGFLLLLAIWWAPAWGDEKRRESIFDRVIHLEEKVHFEIPEVSRLCDELGIAGKHVDIGDCKLFCEREGRGLPIVLVNGGPGGTHTGFHPHFSRAAKFAEVIYYDQRGCGRSDYEPGDGYSFPQAVADLEKLREALGIERWVVLGWSYGGFLAQNYAVEHPDHLAGLVLVGASPAMNVQTGGSRQQMFISSEEQRRIREIYKTPGLSTDQLVYNIHLNGDWKRQNYYRPTRETLARMARYGWVHDPAFRSAIGRDISKIDLEDVFAGFPVPTLIAEGKWDLTWGEVKAKAFAARHPNAQLVMFEKSAHGPFADEPDEFFDVLKGFMKKCRKIPRRKLEKWKASYAEWKKDRAESPETFIKSTGWGRRSNEQMAENYDDSWLTRIHKTNLLMKLGFALYDVERYKDGLKVFETMQERAGTNIRDQAVALVWQGHLLDLMQKRKEAVRRYRKAAALNVRSMSRHDQFGLLYAPSPYAQERIRTPFVRVENRNRE